MENKQERAHDIAEKGLDKLIEGDKKTAEKLIDQAKKIDPKAVEELAEEVERDQEPRRGSSIRSSLQAAIACQPACLRCRPGAASRPPLDLTSLLARRLHVLYDAEAAHPCGPRRSEPIMPNRPWEAFMWAQACEAMERADRLHRQFFRRAHAAPCWEAPCDIFETDQVLTIVIALPGVELDRVQVTLSAGVLIVSGERPLPRELQNARIHRLEIPHGHFERRIELPPARFEMSGRHLANGCLMLQLHKL